MDRKEGCRTGDENDQGEGFHRVRCLRCHVDQEVWVPNTVGVGVSFRRH